jgi:alanine-synthesizing transaminase
MENVRSDIRGAIYDESMRMKAQGIDVLRLNTGNPGTFGFPMPESVKQALIKGMDHAVPYSDSKGLPEARQAIADYHNKVKGFPNVSPERDIYVGNGVSELAQMAMIALLNPGDEILVPMPNYPVWSNAAYIAGAKPVYYMCDEQAGWMPDVESIRKNVTGRTKAILIINPNNPTGVLYSKDVLLDVLQVAREHNLVVFADEIYDRIIMDGLVHHSCAALAPDIFVVTTNGLSKSHIVCGFRSGWMVFSGPTGSATEFITGIHQQASMRLCPNTLAQTIIPAALADNESTQAMVRPGGRLLEQRNATVRELKKLEPLGLSFVEPCAAFYLFLKIDAPRYNITDDKKFCLDLLKAKHIMLINGTGFGWQEPDHVRVIMLPEADKMTKAVRDIGEFLQGYRQE